MGLAELEALATHAATVCGHLEPDQLPGEDLAAAVEAVARVEKLAAGARLRLARRVAACKTWRQQGCGSPAEFLARAAGSTTRAATEDLAASKALERLPATDEALRSGELSATQATTIADAATAAPDAEDDLVAAAATSTVTELRRRARAAKAAADTDPQARWRRLHRQRRLRRWTDTDGAYHLQLRTTPEAGADIDAALQPLADRVADLARAAGRSEPPEAHAADALHLLARTWPAAAGGPDTAADGDRGSGGDDGCGDDDEERRNDGGPVGGEQGGPDSWAGELDRLTAVAVGPATRRREAKVIVLVDGPALARGHAEPGETCEIIGAGRVPVAAVRALLPAAFVAVVVRDQVDVRGVTHLGRAPTALQRTALEARGMLCEVPGCGRRHGLQIDHVLDWAYTRRTRVDELAWLCALHHQLKTEQGWRLEGPPGKRRWVAPEGAAPAAASARAGPPRPPDRRPPAAPAAAAAEARPPRAVDEPGLFTPP